jgi:uncharacterized protein (TIRG00374 family)
MRRIKAVLLVLGIVVVALSVYRVGPAPILETLARLAWWQLVLVCVPYGAIMAVDTLGWRFAFPREAAPFRRLYGARLAGEALNLVTAFGSVGGEAVKAWLIRRDVTYQESVPSVVIAKTTITIAQALFLLIGVALAWATLAVDSRVLAAMLWLLVVEVVAVAGFVGVQVAGLVARAGRLLEWFGVVGPGDHARRLDTALREYYRRDWRRFSRSIGFHLAGWLLGALEAFVILFFLGVPASLVTATVIEALGAGVRFATFLVPASLGAFESANAAAFEAMGLGAGAGLAFSFVRRARQLVWVAIGLLVLAAMGWRVTGAGPQATVSSGTSSSTAS